MRKDISFQVVTAGRAGDGSGTLSEILMRILYAMGAWVFQWRADIYSNIKTRPTCFGLRAADRLVQGPRLNWDLLFALDRSALCDELNEDRLPPVFFLREDGVIIYDSSSRLWDVNLDHHITQEHIENFVPSTIKVFGAPMAKMVEDEFGSDGRDASKAYQARNIVALGIAVRLLNIDFGLAKQEILSKFKNPTAQEINIKAFELGYNYAKEHKWTDERLRKLVSKFYKPAKKRQIIMGDQAIAHGAVAADCKFYAWYPITPASEIGEEMALELGKVGGVVVQAPDEGEAIQNIFGASVGGLRAMTSTSGPGAARMHEGWSAFDAAEQPGVVVLCQRGAPGTGLPTRIGQTDLLDVVFGAHGDKFRIVLAPGNAQECYYFIQTLFNLTDQYQCLGFLLLDQMIAQSHYTVEALDPYRITIDRGKILSSEDIVQLRKENPNWNYLRYELSEDGISFRVIPGTPEVGMYINSNEHCEAGYSIEEQSMRARMVEKRVVKRYRLAVEDSALPEPEVIGKLNARLAFISYGAPSAAVAETIEILERNRINAKALRLRTIWPLDRHLPIISDFLSSARRVYVVEHSTFGQLRHLLQSKLYGNKLTGLKTLARDDGALITPEFILNFLRGDEDV